MTASAWFALAGALAYFLVLGYFAHRGERDGAGSATALGPWGYALSLATLVSGWTLVAAVGDAARQGGAILALFLGPMLAPIVLRPAWHKLRVAAAQQRSTSLADFLGARYGKSQTVAGAIALLAGLITFVLLMVELETLAVAFAVLVQDAPVATSDLSRVVVWRDPVLYFAVLAGSILVLIPGRFANARRGTRQLARISIFGGALGFVGFVALASYAVYELLVGAGINGNAVQNIPISAVVFSQPLLNSRFVAILILAGAALLCLPRLFQFGILGVAEPRGSYIARRLLPATMLLLLIAVLLVTAAGLAAFDSTALNPDRIPIALPLALGNPYFATVAFLSVLAAGSAALVGAAASAAAMLGAEVVLPLTDRLRPATRVGGLDLKRRLIATERGLAIALLAGAWLGYRAISPWPGLADFGLVALAGVALFIPPLIGGLYVPGAKFRGVLAGLAAGFGVWVYTLLLPALAAATSHDPHLLASTAIGISWLEPHALLGVSFYDSLAHGLFWTLFVETAVMTAVSMNTRASLIEHAQAVAFTDPERTQRGTAKGESPEKWTIRVAELEVVLGRFLGDQVARETVNEYVGDGDRSVILRQIADPGLIQFAEDRLAGVVGADAARWLLASGASRGDVGFDDVARVLDRTASAVQFNRGVLRAALENSDQGISVIDSDLRLVTWNSRYIELFAYPAGFVRSGRHIADLIRFNACRGECGPGDVETLVQKRLYHLRRGRPHRFERHRGDGTVLFMTGNPIPGGGFVTTFNDITEFKAKQAELARANAELEARVAERTAALSQSNEQLISENRQRAAAEQAATAAQRSAERANQSKTRFLAAASHDLLQPLNAARLFADAAARAPRGDADESIGQIQTALGAAQALLEPLLDISRLDAGSWPVNRRVCPASEILDPLAEQFRVIADEAGLELSYVTCSAFVDSDPALLARIVMNLVSNAIRYTPDGRVLLGARREPGALRIQVWDTGPGISAEQRAIIFDEFQRGDAPPESGERGLGLGLSLADRLSRLLGHELTLDSTLERGTCFSVRVARAAAPTAAWSAPAVAATPRRPAITGALCIDDDAGSRDALVTTLENWSIETLTAAPADAAAIVADGAVDAAVIDYDLGRDAPDGLKVIARCREQRDIRCVLITANRSSEIVARAAACGAFIVHKPLTAAKLAEALGADTETRATPGPGPSLAAGSGSR